MTHPLTKAGVRKRHLYATEASPAMALLAALCEYYTSDKEEENYGSPGAAPPMKPWLGKRSAAEIAAYEIILRNQMFEHGIPIPAHLVRRQKWDLVNSQIDALAARGVEHWLDLLFSFIVAAESRVTWDGQFFFDTDHSSRASGNQSNDITTDITTPTAPTVADASAAILKSIAQMVGFLDDFAAPMNEHATSFLIIANHLLLPTIGAALGNDMIQGTGGAIDNPVSAFSGYQFQLRATPRMGWSTDKFAMFILGRPNKPFIRQEEPLVDDGIEILGEGSDYYFNNDKYLVGRKASRAFGYGNWQLGCLHTWT